MLKCNVTVNGVISRAATIRKDNEGKDFITFGVKVIVPTKYSTVNSIDIGVTIGGTQSDLQKYPLNSRISLTGMMTFKKKGDNLYINLRADEAKTDSVGADAITGTLMFRGTIKNLDLKEDKKGKGYLVFDAYSSDKLEDGSYSYIWVRFIRFSETLESFLADKAGVNVNGDVQLTLYKDKLNISSKINSLEEWDKAKKGSHSAEQGQSQQQ